MSVNLQLDAGGDLLISNGQLVLGDNVAQRLATRLRMMKGEWFLALDDGTPYLQQGDEIGSSILGPNVSPEFVRSAFTDRILGTEGITGLIALDMTVDHVRRTLSVTATASTAAGAVQVTV